MKRFITVPYFQKFTLILYFLLIANSILLQSCKSKETLKQEQMVINGGELYLQHCANCHQANGEGLGDLYPPIKGSDYLVNREKIICLIKNGISGDMVVNGKTYNQAMPANRNLYDLDIASIMTYIYSEWEGEKSIVEVGLVHKTLENCENVQP